MTTPTRESPASPPAAVAFLVGPDLVVGFATDAWRRLTGEHVAVGVPLLLTLPELAEQGLLDQLGQIMASGEPAEGIETGAWIQPHGARSGRVLVDLACQPVRGADGAVAGVLLYATDVIASAEAEDRTAALAGDLAASEERYRTLFETMPQGIVHYDADGSIIGANKAACEILGMDLSSRTSWPIIPTGQAIREDGSPFPPGEMPVPLALRTGEIVTGIVIGVTHGKTGEQRWVSVTAVPDARDDQGRPSRAYAILADLTEQRRTATALGHSTALLGRLREANVLGVVVLDEDHVYEANDAYLDIIGYNREDLDSGRIAWRALTPPEWASVEDRALEQLRRTGACQPFEKEYVHRDGHRVPVLIGAAAISRSPLRWTSFVVDLTARQRAEQERTALLVSARASRAAADSARERLALVMRAGTLVAATRDPGELLDQVAQLAVPSLADYCVVFLPATDGRLRASSISHRDPARARVLARLRDHPIARTGPLITQRAYTEGTTQLSRDVSADMTGWAEAEPEAMNIYSDIRPRSAIAAPLPSPGGPLGVLMLGRHARRARFDAADVQLVEELSRHLAIGLANTDTFVREHAIAETLQRSLLPSALPRVPGLDLAVRYLPATEGANVGGDWYDGFLLPDGRVGLVIGDVLGHNITSASIMGQLRSLFRGYAIEEPAPGRLLERVNAALTYLLPDVLASAVYAALDPATGDLSYANAGHPPPLVSSGKGQAEYLDDATGIMLGACAGADFTVGHRRLGAGARLLFYTDGLVEDRRRDISGGLAILAETLRRSAPGPAEQLCATVHAALLGAARREDDVCLLAVGRTG